jgi:hypothetical protein
MLMFNVCVTGLRPALTARSVSATCFEWSMSPSSCFAAFVDIGLSGSGLLAFPVEANNDCLVNKAGHTVPQLLTVPEEIPASCGMEGKGSLSRSCRLEVKHQIISYNLCSDALTYFRQLPAPLKNILIAICQQPFESFGWFFGSGKKAAVGFWEPPYLVSICRIVRAHAAICRRQPFCE